MSRKHKLYLVFAGLVFCLLSAAAAMAAEGRAYENQMKMIYTMVAGEKAGVDNITLVSQLLKGQTSPGLEEAGESLEELGFVPEYENVFRKALNRKRGITVAIAAVSWILFLTAVCWQERLNNISRRKGIQQIEHVINRLRVDCSTSGNIPFDSTLTGDAAEKSLEVELVSLADYVKLTKERSEIEKEETKALVTDISHQLKTPVAALRTSFEILCKGGVTEEERFEFEERCESQILRLQELVAALVNISRMEKGMIEIRKEEGCIFDTIVLAMNRIWHMAQEKQIELSLEADEREKKLRISYDGKWLPEAIINILENAVKYSPPGTAVTIRLILVNYFLRVEIEDEGIGIPREEQHQVFKRFYRGAGVEVRKKQGSGVGLYLAREIMERHSGTLTVGRRAGKKRGCLFVLQLPVEGA